MRMGQFDALLQPLSAGWCSWGFAIALHCKTDEDNPPPESRASSQGRLRPRTPKSRSESSSEDSLGDGWMPLTERTTVRRIKASIPPEGGMRRKTFPRSKCAGTIPINPAWRNRLAGTLAGGRASRAEATKSGLEAVKWAEGLILA